MQKSDINLQPDRVIYSIGTSTRTLEEFLSIIKEYKIDVLVDIRSFPKSRFPHFIKGNLEKSLNSIGIQYFYLGKELGGFRKGGYIAYMESENFGKGLELLEEIGREKRAAFFCSERFPWRCHRRWVAGRLMQKGWKVIHIIEKGRVWM